MGEVSKEDETFNSFLKALKDLVKGQKEMLEELR